jgi:peptidyl-tRNA hydrolase
MKKLYIVTRKDLSAGLKLSQSIHAAQQFQREYPRLAEDWMVESNTLVVVEVDNQLGLETLIIKARSQKISYTRFEDSDFPVGEKLGAIALAPVPETEKLCRNLPLVFS